MLKNLIMQGSVMEPVATTYSQEPFSSQTQESLSLLTTERFSVRKEDADKFVSRWDEEAVSASDLSKKLSKLQQTLSETSQKLATMQQAIQWRKAQQKDFQTFAASLKDIEDTLDKLSRKLNGGICRQVATVQEKGTIGTIMRSIFGLQMELLGVQKQATSLKSLTQAGHVIEAYVSVKQVMPSLFAVITDQASAKFDTFIEATDIIIKQYAETIHPQLNDIFTGNPTKAKIDAFVQTVKTAPAKKAEAKEEHIKLHARRALSLEMLRTSCVIANAIFENKQKSKINPRLSWRITLLKALIEHASACLEKKPLKPPAPTAAYSEAVAQAHSNNDLPPEAHPVAHLLLDEVITPEHLQNLKEPFHTLSFWPTTGISSYWYTVAGYYPRTGTLATALDADVAAGLSGIVLKVKRHLAACMSLECNLVAESEEIQHTLNHYWKCLKALETTFDRYFEQICRTPFDDLTQHVLDYAHGLTVEFRHAKRLIKLAYKCSENASARLFAAAKELDSAYTILPEQTLRLYGACLRMKEAASLQPKHTSHPFDAFLSHSLDVLNEVHAKKDPELLALTGPEAQVPAWILSQIPLEALYERGEDQSLLPSCIRDFISKRITRFFFLPSDAHDMELELTLFAIRHNDAANSLLAKSFEHSQFENLVLSYDTSYGKDRLADKQLHEAHIIAAHIFSGDLFTFTRGQQLLFEYLKAYEGPQIDAIQKMLAHYIQAECTKHGYDPIYPLIAKRDIETWKIEGNTPQDFLRELAHACGQMRALLPNIQEQHVFNAVLVRLLAASLFATSVEEQIVAHRHLLCIYAADAYEPFLSKLSATTKELVCRATMQKILTCSFDTGNLKDLALPAQEFAFLYNGPIKQFFSGDAGNTDMVEMVLFKLIMTNPQDDTLKNRFIQSKGKFQFTRWISDFDLLASTNLVAEVASEYIEID